MKKFITLSMLTLISTSAMATDFACQPKYDRHITSKAVRTLGGSILTIGAGAGTAVGSAGAILLGASIGAAPFLGVGALYGYSAFEARNFESYVNSRNAIKEAYYPGGKEEAIGYVVEAEKQRLQKKLNDKINPQRERDGQPTLTLDAYLEQNPLKVDNSPLEELVEQINKHSRRQTTYEEVALKIRELGSDDSLCKNDRVLGSRNLRRFLVDELRNEEVVVNNSDRNEVKSTPETSQQPPLRDIIRSSVQ